ncbi:DUF456 domain-containing protein [Geoalkalibacter halelectricus]|uniref:DUF456 domain-containing protein n=1 Tax=Geoalkalibacter halelectricus TaxID=2847045 RepID=A0ABY5ZQG8_9BACT|nr:DUF456 domain-containing protein [Geoalkalibacter halelectricus]MDO3377626.1 DUF456 domain-containing protein [Geoalkalibacter halelectricus]UWZ81417.1 DUF456 domain-containing protein [Geoalkalibacter halelectricus]
MTTLLLLLLAVVLVLLGLAGLILPALPAAPLIFSGLLLAAWAEDFAYVGWRTLTALGGLAGLAMLADFVAGAFGAKHFGATHRAVIGAAIGAVVGLFFGFLGILFGPFLGAVAGELTARNDLRAAGRAGIGALIGLVLGVAAKTALAFTMIGLFLLVRILAGS